MIFIVRDLVIITLDRSYREYVTAVADVQYKAICKEETITRGESVHVPGEGRLKGERALTKLE